MLGGKNILIGITGSIAAYKIPLLVRLLAKEGANVRVIMTPAARDFVTPLTLSTLSKAPVWSEAFNRTDGSWNSHVDLGQWADLFLVAPASASTLGKMAHGIADNFLMTAYLSAKCPVFFAPAMDLDMYRHPTTQENIRKLQEMGHHLIEPQVGELASGLCGAGRMEEPETMLEVIRMALAVKDMNGIKAIVTAGPTYEPIDPVRFLGNHSSGKMGFALAENLARRGADVTLITGPTSLQTILPGIRRIDISTAAEMHESVMSRLADTDVVIMAAAVADFSPVEVFPRKIKKGTDSLTSLELKPTTDILADIGRHRTSGQVITGFALETDNEAENARKKLLDKNADLIVMNSLRDEGAGFGTSTNKIIIFSRDGSEYAYPLRSKEEVAGDIVNEIHKRLHSVGASH
jgi:phosphopantothenoylcysteine decarboxylase/phosphopantothenate--cysteine ligase